MRPGDAWYWPIAVARGRVKARSGIARDSWGAGNHNGTTWHAVVVGRPDYLIMRLRLVNDAKDVAKLHLSTSVNGSIVAVRGER